LLATGRMMVICAQSVPARVLCEYAVVRAVAVVVYTGVTVAVVATTVTSDVGGSTNVLDVGVVVGEYTTVDGPDVTTL